MRNKEKAIELRHRRFVIIAAVFIGIVALTAVAIHGNVNVAAPVILASVAPLGWVEIFRTGKHTDSAGNTREWTEADIEKIAAGYKPEEHEAPVVIGHPKDNAPAFGWVEALKRDGQVLLAKFKELAPEFMEMLKNGLFKKRSVALYPDLGLRHVGFLGAQPPAVKGLKDVKFSETENFAFEFDDGDAANPLAPKIEQPSPAASNSVTPTTAQTTSSGSTPPPPVQPATQPPNGKTVVAPAENNFTEQLGERDKKIAGLEQELEKLKADRRRERFSGFCDKMTSLGKILPAERDAIVAIMEKLDGGELQFGEKKIDGVATFMKIIESRPRMIYLDDFANGKTNTAGASLSPTQIVRNEIAASMNG